MLAEFFRTVLESAKSQITSRDEIAKQLEAALEDEGVTYGFSVSEVAVASDLSEAGALLMRDDYVTEVFVGTCPSTLSIYNIK
ncbi:MAG: hypothetical protein WC050_00420 [Candidatus Paceibacterota bacterium]